MSALYALEHSNVLFSLIAIFPTYLVWNLFVSAIEIITLLISDYELAEKVTSRLYKLGILVSLVVAMLYTETPDNFQLLATLISFCLIFQYFIPKDFPHLTVEIHRSFVKKRRQYKNHKKK